MKAILSPAQSVEARENLNLQQPAVVSGVKSQHPDITFTKTYLSEFESGSRNLPLKTLRCLLDFYEAQGHEFTDAPEAANDPQAGEQVRVVRDAVVVCDRLTHAQRGAIQDQIRNLLAELKSDLRQKASKGMFDLYDDDTDLARDKAIAVFAEIGLLYASLFGSCLLKTPSEALLNAPREAETISDVISIRFAEALKFTASTPLNPVTDDGSAKDLAGGDSQVANSSETQSAPPSTTERFSLENL